MRYCTLHSVENQLKHLSVEELLCLRDAIQKQLINKHKNETDVYSVTVLDLKKKETKK